MGPKGHRPGASGELVAVVDMGTSGCKVILFDPSGDMVAQGFHPYANRQVAPGRVEQDPMVWWGAVCRAARGALEGMPAGARLGAVSVTSQRASAIPVDGQGRALRPAIQTQDKRSTPQCDRIRKAFSPEEIYRRTGLIVDPYFVAPKILWIKEEEPEVFDRASKFLTVQDFIVRHLCGQFVIDDSQASRTLLFNIVSRAWDGEILAELGIPPEKLPETRPPGAVVGALTPQAARETGLPAGTPVVQAGGDQPCAALGNGAMEPQVLSATTGTGTYVLAPRREAAWDPEMRFLCSCHVVPDRWAIEAGIMVTGAGLPWFLNHFAGLREETEGPYRALEEMAGGSPIGAQGLLFIPHFAGSVAPYWNPRARACFHGLTLGHGRGDAARALVEGIFLEVKKCIDLLSPAGMGGLEVRVSGGVTKSAFFNQLQADIYGLTVRRAREEATALGAAILGARAVGWYASLEETLHAMSGAAEAEVKIPDPESHRLYQEVLVRHDALCLALKSGGF